MQSKSLAPQKLIVIGASAGGVNAIYRLLKSLDSQMQVPIVVVQHVSPRTSIDLEKVYGKRAERTILEAEDKMPILPSHVYFAPPAYHLMVSKDKTFSLSQDDAIHFSRPSIDVLFESAAEVYQERLTGILLTGANHDGASGLKLIKACGGTTFVQDPAEAEVDVMPKAALATHTPDHVGSLISIAEAILLRNIS